MNAYLHLQDGDVIEGDHFGFVGETEGEVVFSTGMTGYVESLTDPSFSEQILVFTYPLIGNYGVPKPIQLALHLMKNLESEKIWTKGVIVANYSNQPSHYQSQMKFADWLEKEKVPGLSLVDTRMLTHKIRENGVMRGKISMKKTPPKWGEFDMSRVVANASTKKVIKYLPDESNGKTLALIDCGVKHGIIRQLLKNGFTVIRIPWDMNPLDIQLDPKEKIAGVVCSNGPGDPKDCAPTIANIRAVLAAGLPFLGICLGHQLLALSIGADTYKLPYGHRGLNQPCQDLSTQRAYLTSQNHGYAVDRKTIPVKEGFEEWFINLNDQTSEGLRNLKKKIWSVQFHPEGQPGPFDTDWIFELLK